jgi:hypothetical protein
MAKTTFSGSHEFEQQVHTNFPTIHFSRIQLNEKRKVYMVNPALGIVVVFNYATQGATYYRLNTPKELSAETLGKLFAHYANTNNTEMESVIREFIHHQKGIAFLEPQAYVDIVELGWGGDLKNTSLMFNTHASYDKDSENFNRAMAVYRKAMEKGIKAIEPNFTNAFEFASNVAAVGNELYYSYANKLESMGVPASETFSGEYFDALFERKAKAAEKEQEEDEETPTIVVGQACIIDCNGVPQIINFGLFIF